MSHRKALAALALVVFGFACTADDPLTAPAHSGDHQVSEIHSTTPAPLYLAASDATQARPDHYIVKLKDELVTKDSLHVATAGILASTQAESQKIWSTFRGFYARIPSDEVERLLQHRLVEYIEEDQTVPEEHFPSGLFGSGTQTSAPWHLDRIDQDSYPLDGNYSYDSSGDGVRIYVIDSGVRATHNDFGGRASNKYQANSNWDPPYTDCFGHGTAVASAAAGTTWGAAKDATIIGVRVNDCIGDAYTSDIIDGMEWVANNRVRPAVANISYNSDSRAVEDAAEDLIDEGVIVVTPAGNDNEPACDASRMHSVTSVIVVGAMNKGTDSRAYFSNYGSCVDLYAPGRSMTLAGIDNDSNTRSRSGTSYAAPLAAGAAAMYLEHYPNDSPDRVHEVLRLGATYANSSASPFLYVKQPRIKRVYWSGPTTVSSTEECTWRANVVGGRGPFTYVWSGVLSGSGNEITGQVASTGILTLKVSGPRGQSASYQEWVRVGSPANCPD